MSGTELYCETRSTYWSGLWSVDWTLEQNLEWTTKLAEIAENTFLVQVAMGSFS